MKLEDLPKEFSDRYLRMNREDMLKVIQDDPDWEWIFKNHSHKPELSLDEKILSCFKYQKFLTSNEILNKLNNEWNTYPSRQVLSQHLLKLSKYGEIKRVKRGQWEMKIKIGEWREYMQHQDDNILSS